MGANENGLIPGERLTGRYKVGDDELSGIFVQCCQQSEELVRRNADFILPGIVTVKD
jgi:hypothetical protein